MQKIFVIAIYNNDGPGFLNKIFYSDNFESIKDKIKMFVPDECVIGFLLNHVDNYKVVKAKGSGILKHDLNNWLCYGKTFINSELSIESKNIEKRVITWLNEHTIEEREKMVVSFFTILKNSNIVSFNDLQNFNLIKAINLIRTTKDFDKDGRELVLSALKILFFGRKDID